jgi:hypothetical protein
MKRPKTEAQPAPVAGTSDNRLGSAPHDFESAAIQPRPRHIEENLSALILQICELGSHYGVAAVMAHGALVALRSVLSGGLVAIQEPSAGELLSLSAELAANQGDREALAKRIGLYVARDALSRRIGGAAAAVLLLQAGASRDDVTTAAGFLVDQLNPLGRQLKVTVEALGSEVLPWNG